MNEELERILRDRNLDARTFFRIAHLWAFGTDPIQKQTITEYETEGRIPRFVERYIEHITKGDHNAMR